MPPIHTFKSSHPLCKPRIEQLERLKYDLETGNIQFRKPTIDWTSIAIDYLS